MTPEKLLERIVAGRTDLVWEYVAQGQAATASDPDGVPLIRWCAYYGDVSAMRFLLDHGESLSSLGENHGLLGAGAAREARDVNGDTPLSWASWHARPDAILRRLCYGPFTIRPDRQTMRAALLGKP